MIKKVINYLRINLVLHIMENSFKFLFIQHAIKLVIIFFF